jgi:predicted AAA+ superfamily ATPase
MRLRPRLLEGALRRALREFPAVVVVGLRQCGKTTLVRRVDRARRYVTLDDLSALAAAHEDPQGFIRGLPAPVTIDEIQKAPELLAVIKQEIDRVRRPGRFLLTGSAQIEGRRAVRETLAGRAALLRLRPMTWGEADGRAAENPARKLAGCRSVRDVVARFGRGPALDPARILAGGLPEPMLGRSGAARRRWFAEYRRTYVERDVPSLLRLEEVPAFVRFISLAASRTAQTTNFAALSHDAGVSADTGLRWFGVLELSFLVDPLPPYFRNIGKRLVKSPKLHFGDTGLAASLAGVDAWSEARRHRLDGALLETLVAQHLLAYAQASGAGLRVYHYRTHAGGEVDLVLEHGARLVPIEVKLTATPRPSDARGLASFIRDHDAPFGIVLHAGEDSFPLSRTVAGMPLTRFLGA